MPNNLSTTELSALQRRYWSRDQSERRPPSHPVVRALYEPRVAYLASLVEDPTRASVLDVGCGNGFMTIPLERRFRRVVGADYSEAMLTANPCHEKCLAPAWDLPFADREFDLVVANHLLHHLADPDRRHAVREMDRVARGGLVLYEPNRNNPLMFALGLLQKEERMLLRFSARYLRELLGQSSMARISVRAEGLIVPNKAPTAWIPVSALLDRTPLRICGFYLRGVALRV
jgi:SAM-dependent methyltransferase